MTTIEIPGFTTADMVVWFRSQPKKMGCYRKIYTSLDFKVYVSDKDSSNRLEVTFDDT